ncbi:glucosidase [Schizosaccharomyces cryophilus OY26]|uniref:Glucosidase n=1 Tax=Schizosaccharomyces cryophilus (strain OY26 / ATCC MYA-4695 / CBS 11777 / NBRC 106824 / NRRL Y48691) TaxID=653667 RepID=S9W2P5_SCHCR|nr:glucosidase [Schizosaccharomyces cryophilus OY26]EPY52784.1 glucosidase [Schizosaccharomyces cryophilus OY26]
MYDDTPRGNQPPANVNDLGSMYNSRDTSASSFTNLNDSSARLLHNTSNPNFSSGALAAGVGGRRASGYSRPSPQAYNRYPNGDASGSDMYSTSPPQNSSLVDDIENINRLEAVAFAGPTAGDHDFALSKEDKEIDDFLHYPLPTKDAKKLSYFVGGEGFMQLLFLIFLISGTGMLFIGLPILTYTGHNALASTSDNGITNHKFRSLSLLRHRSLVDPDTPQDAYKKDTKSSGTLDLVFSDEFNTPGRTFYEGDDQFWEASDLHYAATSDYEYYDADVPTTANGTLRLRMDAFFSHNLNLRSGMITSWNKMCFKGGRIEVSASLGGKPGTPGLWPGIWTIGNLVRPGYLATSDGVWPYAYNSCDAGITPNQSDPTGLSFLGGQRLPNCACEGQEDKHPSIGTGRGAPEIDCLEGTFGSGIPYNGSINMESMPVASQSLQTAPYDVYYYPNYDYVVVYNQSVSSVNGWTGGVYQQALSVATQLNNTWLSNNAYQTYGFDYEPGYGPESYISWFVGDAYTWTMYQPAISRNGNVGPRGVSEEPLIIVLNMGISPTWVYFYWNQLTFPQTQYIDYVRIYQNTSDSSKHEIGCDPEGYPTTEYIERHPNAYRNYNATSWEMAGYKRPKNKLMDGC